MDLTLSQKRKLKNAAVLIALTLFVLVWLLPVFGAFMTAFRTMGDLSNNGFWSLPEQFTISNFAEAWTDGNLNTYLKNSFIITIPALLGTLALSSLVGFALAKYDFKGNMALYLMFVGGMLIPFQILLIPVFGLSNFLGIYNNYLGLIMIHMVFQMGFCSFFLRNYMITIPDELSEAARIDGASEFRIFYKIYLPLSKPALAALATLQFTWIFNDYIWALVLLRDDKFRPVTAGLATLQGNFITSYTVLVAGAILATLPTIAVFIFLQKYFIRGLTMGSGK
ncbi:MAG: carbohydrate ABC transporter permease [Halanaerobium sp.]